MSGNFLSCSKVVKDPLEVAEVRADYPETPQHKCASSRLEGRTSWIFSSCGRCSRLTTVTSESLSGGHRKGQSPCELLAGFSEFHSRRCWVLRPCMESVPEPEDSSPVLEPEDSSPVLTWTLGYFWSLPRGVSLRLQWGHARVGYFFLGELYFKISLWSCKTSKLLNC